MPTRLGRYAVRRRIGSGGFATVWLAYDEQLDSPVAIKVLADNWTEDNHVRGRFLEEGRLLRRVESPHVVSVYDAGELDDGRPYLVMSYADQGTLADRLEEGGLTPRQTLEVVRQVGLGLAALHQHQILHRDVKPANVLFRSTDQGLRAMLGDLGLGKAIDMSSRLTMIAGTPTFAAPEQAQGERLDPRADQYSLGALTFLLLSGRPPYAHASLHAAAHPGAPPSLSTPDRPFTAAVDRAVCRAIAVDREDRFPSVTAFVSALESALSEDRVVDPAVPAQQGWLSLDSQRTQPGNRPSSLPVGEPLPDPTPPSGVRRRRWVTPVVAALALVLGAAAGWWGLHRVERDVTRTDPTDSLTVTVPDTWSAEASDAWTPPGSTRAYPALSLGTSRAWSTQDGQGVFVGLLPGSRLPPRVPQHPECDPPLPANRDTINGDASVTGYFSGCPGVIVERVVKVTAGQLMWVQVRAEDRATANAVLDSVVTHGM